MPISGPAVAAVAAGAAASIAVGRALDARYSIRTDLAQIQAARKSRKHLEGLMKTFEPDQWSFYHILHGDPSSVHGATSNHYDECFLFEDRSWTYGEVRAEVGRLALALQDMGVRNRTVVAMCINNSPEFFFLWWALFKIGAIPAPLNTLIAHEPFRHCLKISAAEFLIVSYELVKTTADSLNLGNGPSLSEGQYSDSRLPDLKTIAVYDYGTYPPPDVVPEAKVVAQRKLPPVTADMAAWPLESRPAMKKSDISQYLFTSGTTGLPKAASFPAVFAQMIANPWRWPVMFKKRRRAYICTPMFHGGATYALLPAVIAQGGTVVLARRFSVRNFWHDVRRTRANMLFYIGEMARYLTQASPDPIHPDESKTHELEIMYGLGISGPVWRAFQTRFRVPQIVEYYGATEATTMISYSASTDEQEVAKVAHWGPIMRYVQDTFYIIKVDMETEEVIRDPKTGFCIQAAFDEIGEAITRITPPHQATHDYVGPDGPAATEKKILRDVFRKGDEFVRVGDALSMDPNGYVTFHDRLGDTFRAKGHNISTAEVESAFFDHPKIGSANVFSVDMKRYGYEGQLGAAAVTIRGGATAEHAGSDEAEAVQNLEHYLTTKAGLPGYAVPRFLRVIVDPEQEADSDRAKANLSEGVGSEHVSPILKKLKAGLRSEGFSPPQGSRDRVYWIPKEGEGFTALDDDTKQRLLQGKARF